MPLLDFGALEVVGDLPVQADNDVSRRAGGRNDREEAIDRYARHCFAHRGQVGQSAKSRHGRYGNAAHFAGIDNGLRGRNGTDHHLIDSARHVLGHLRC